MRPTTKRSTSNSGQGWLVRAARGSQGAVLVALSLLLAPPSVMAEQDGSQVPSWQQPPDVQQTGYISPVAPGGVQTTSWRTGATTSSALPQRQAYRSARNVRTMPVSQAVMAESAGADGAPASAPEEIYPEATPGTDGYGPEMPLMDEGGAYYEGCGDCGETCGDMGSCWGPGEFYGGCGPWLGLMEPGRLWVRGEALLWWTKGVDLPPLVTTSPNGTDYEDAGLLNDDGTVPAGTSILFGNQEINDGSRNGGRITFGLRPTACTPWGVEASYLHLGTETTDFFLESQGYPILARPYFRIEENAAASHVIVFREGADVVQTGWIDIEADTRLNGVEVLFRRGVYDWCTGRLDFLAGWRSLHLSDDLDIAEYFEKVGEGGDPTIPVGTTVELLDQFKTRNLFNGGEVGFVTNMQYRRWSLEMLMKVAFGSTKSRVAIDGWTTFTDDQGDWNTEDGGLLALPSNMGVTERNEFTMIPEFGFTLGFDLTCRLRATVGYSVIYWGKVARAADQLSLDVNTTQMGGAEVEGLPRPSRPFVTNDFWAQGLGFGLEYHF